MSRIANARQWGRSEFKAIDVKRSALNGSKMDYSFGGRRTRINSLGTHIIKVDRTVSTNMSTISTLDIDDGNMTGYFLEPSGPSSIQEGSGLRIQEGIYQLKHHSGPKFSNHFELQDVPGRTNVLIHGGIGPKNTSACLVIGNKVGHNSISGWRQMMKQLRTYISANGGARNFFIMIN